MKIFLTGASGFIGGAIAKALAQDHSLWSMSRSDASDRAIRKLGGGIVRCELGNVHASQLTGVDVLIHCAAYVGPWGTQEDFWRANVEGVAQLLQAARAAGVKRFIHMSTEAAFFCGKDLIDIDESRPYPDRNPYYYGASKMESEKIVLAANSESFETIVLRPRLVWGPGDTSILPVLKKMVTTKKFLWIDGGKAKTSTTNIHNLVHAVRLTLTRGKGGQAYFITDGEDSTLRWFLTAMMETQNIKMPKKSVSANIARKLAYFVEGFWKTFGLKSEPPLMRFATDLMACECTVKIDRARSELGYLPAISVMQGLAKMKQAYLDGVHQDLH
ncbi:MAG: NAD-dependent epimerase/dehydratase family protein [Arenimonas sp.]